ncbi:alcohol dehydrogenase catalytic domain-containing protein [Nocardioides sp.]|uniref:alcohol dehydrogenase catalytic domain-containing protein n=1 Tax=Nocardioides sp. TaxID=35761 RepID=UPI0035B02088
MQALRWHGNGDLRLEETPKPTAERPDDVVIEVEVCGICGTDVHEYVHGPQMIRTAEHPLTGARPPITLGHEFAGYVSSVGSHVDDLEIGQLVTVDPCLRCGDCAACQRGDYHICAQGGSIGLAADGGLADFVVVPRVNVIAVPDGVPAVWAAVAEPLAVGLHAARRAGVGAGDTVLITGAGPIGIASLLGAISLGAGAVFVSEPSAARAQLALHVGATEVFDPLTVDVRREVFLRSGRVGPDRAIEATGRPEAFELGLTSLRRGGRLSIAGITDSALTFPLRQLVLYEREVVGSLGYNRDIERVLQLMATGRLDPGPFVKTVRPLSQAPDTFANLSAGPADELKILLSPAKDI